MSLYVLNTPASEQSTGFTRSQFQKLDQLYMYAASKKALTYRTVDCDFNEGLATYTYFQAASHTPSLQFAIRKVGPRTTLFELYCQGKGRVMKSSVFERVFESLAAEVERLVSGGH
ncbi:MAG: hypothetical protein KA099_00475 [Alphaproteobacteria bacterium]|nr:hypothetical protein [Alphaproteobacteria bacterium]MBP7757957.1 hypothetical protein [Alphaproteobacteria bacterium]MBP7761284.1 hypothetical protein [Alphaproteobacteria bacterium]MBP7903774.1 hypothetical protein [Alphaproteobacteria bacterium]